MKYLFLIFLFSCNPSNPPENKPVENKPVEQVDLKSTLSEPWKKPETSIVIDAYEGNGIDWEKMAKDKKVVGVIHRSSSGLKIDKKFGERKFISKEKGYLFGAYHLGARGDTIKQADLFISFAQEKDTMMFLDLEDTSNSKMMTVDEAVVFMDYFYKKTGKILSVYANHSVTLALNSKLKENALFKKSKLWYARFKSKVSDFPIGVWNNYFLWQFSSEINCSKTGTCLYNVPGTSFDMDINVFYGSKEELKNQWNN